MFKRLLVIMVLFAAIFSITLVVAKQHPTLANNAGTKLAKKLPEQQHQATKKKGAPRVGLEVGNRAPNITLENLQGKTVSLSDFRGKKVMLNFWATWCPPCREEIPNLVKFYKASNHKDIVILAVNMTSMEQGGPEAVKAFSQKYEMDFPILLDDTSDAMTTYGVVTIPTTYLLNEDGEIVAKHIGPVDGQWIEQHMSNQ